MLYTLETWDPSQEIQPFQRPEDARQDAGVFGPSQTILFGTVLGRKTSDNKLYPWVHGNSDGTQTPVAVNKRSLMTDANGQVFYQGSTTPSRVNSPWTTSVIYKSGIFAVNDIVTGSLVAEVDTFTPATVTTGDVNKLTITYPDLSTRVISATVGATATAAAISALLIAAWNADPYASQLATASGTNTVVLTAKRSGVAFSVASSVTGTGTLTRAATTAASGRSITNLLTDWPGSRLLHNGIAISLP